MNANVSHRAREREVALTLTSTAVGVAMILAGLGIASGYPTLLRKRILTWGATREEAVDAMPGDELLPEPAALTTRAVTVAAAPEAIWPWLVQMGPGRGGAYTYDWIENLLGLNMHSADTILPQFQDLSVGDTFPLGANGPRLRVAIMDPGNALVFASTDGNWVWAFVLRPTADGTRLISRNRIATAGANAPARLFNRLIMEPGSLVMERKMLRGIAQRAERTAVARVTETVPH